MLSLEPQHVTDVDTWEWESPNMSLCVSLFEGGHLSSQGSSDACLGHLLSLGVSVDVVVIVNIP